MAIAYPTTLPTARRASKSRSQGAPFRATNPGQAKLYVERSGADNPVVWSLEFRFSRAQAVEFMDWFEDDLDRGLLDFTLPIRTEFGANTYTCRFLPDGLLDCRQDGETFTYSAKVITRAQIIPPRFIDAADMILTLQDWKVWASLLDQTVTEELP